MSSRSQTRADASDSETTYQVSERYYWANEAPDRIGAAVRHFWEEYQNRLEYHGHKTIWRRSWLAHHGRNPDGGYANAHTVTFGGEDGETAMIHMGHYRRHIKGRKQMATGQRPAFEVAARDDGPEAISAVKVARQVFEHDLDRCGLERDFGDTHERALLYAEGYYIQMWDARAGETITKVPLDWETLDEAAAGIPELDEANATNDPQDKFFAQPTRNVTAGDIVGLVRSPLDVARDMSRDTVKDPPWFIVRDRVHRWELARHYPESSEARKKILNAPSAESENFQLFDGDTHHEASSDYIERLTLIHMKTNARPDGRIVEVIGEYALPGTDRAYPYEHCCVHQHIPSPETDRCWGYSDNWDLLAPTQALDAVETSILSLLDAGSLVNWVAPKSSGVKVKDLKGKLQLVEYEDQDGRFGPPVVMDRPHPQDSDFKASEHYQGHMRVLSGQNAVVQGDPEANIKSGNFAALVASMAVTAANDEVSSYAELMRSVMNGRLELYQRFMKTERTIELTGKDNESHVLTFTSDTLAGATRVDVEIGSPVSRTAQGKADFARQLFDMYGPQVITPSQFMALWNTGRMEAIEPSAFDEDKLGARRENDLIIKGKAQLVIVAKTDHHACHLREHRKQLNDPAFRYSENPDPARVQAIQALMAHIDAHENMWDQVAQMQPALLMATGQEPPPPKAMGPMGGPPPGAGAPPGGPPGGSQGLPPGGGNPAAGDPAMPPGVPDNIEPAQPAKNPLNPEQAPVPGAQVPMSAELRG